MRINHNIAALNTHRQLTSNTAGASKSLEKLSSGLRINRAGDDAAGLAISEKMRAQIRGLDMASKNAQDGISLIQTAEGALGETHSILQRMRELADQSANGTNTAEDRKNIQDEIKQLKEEIDRIGNTTEFNTQKLLNGALNGAGATNGTNSVTGSEVFKMTKGTLAGVDASTVNGTDADYTKTDALLVDGKKIDIDWNKYLTDNDKLALEVDWSGGTAMDTTQSNKVQKVLERVINQAIDDSGTGAAHISVKVAADGRFTLESGTKGNNSKVELYLGDGANQTAKLADGTDAVGSNSVLDLFVGASAEMAGTITSTSGTNTVLETVSTKFNIKIGDHTLDSITAAFTAGQDANTNATALETAINNAITTYNTARGLTEENEVKNVTVKVQDGRLVIDNPSGAIELTDVEPDTLEKLGLDRASRESAGNGAMSFQIGANKGQTIAFSLGDMRTNALGISGVDVSTKTGAEDALTKLDSAISSVSSTRSKLGAIQNRLEHTINNLQTASENLTAAESRIRDVDMAKEMMDFTKNNILSQAAQAMLAQANQQPQGVLQLLR